MLARIRRAVAALVDALGYERQADPADYGFTDAAVDEMVAGARGDTVTRARLLGPSADAPLLEHLVADEQPHHAVPGTDLAVEMEGDRMTTDSGYLVVTDRRVLVMLYEGLTVGRNEVDYDHVEAIHRGEADDPREVTLETPARTLTVRTPADEWGPALEAAVDEIREQWPREREQH